MAEEKLYTFENEEYRKTYWHTCSHVLAQAMKRLHPEVTILRIYIINLMQTEMFWPHSLQAVTTPEIFWHVASLMNLEKNANGIRGIL